MWNAFYGLTADPFRLGPDSSFSFDHGSYRKAKAYLRYALSRAEGFALITGAAGTGKSTLIDDMVNGLDRSKIAVARIVTTRLRADDLLRMLAYDLGVHTDPRPNKAEVLHALLAYLRSLREAGKRAVVIVDEAQGLIGEALEELRLLSNQAVEGEPLVQVFLVGQDELRSLVHRPGMEQLQQRIVANCQLSPLNAAETRDFVKHRLTIAGWKGDPEIEDSVFAAVHRFSYGIPRRINIMCGRLFLDARMNEAHKITGADAADVLEELREELQHTDGFDGYGGHDEPSETAPDDVFAESVPSSNVVRVDFTESRQESAKTEASEKPKAKPEVTPNESAVAAEAATLVTVPTGGKGKRTAAEAVADRVAATAAAAKLGLANKPKSAPVVADQAPSKPKPPANAPTPDKPLKPAMTAAGSSPVIGASAGESGKPDGATATVASSGAAASVLPKGTVNQILNSQAKSLRDAAGLSPAPLTPEVSEQAASSPWLKRMAKLAAVIAAILAILVAVEQYGIKVDGISDSFQKGWKYVDAYIGRLLFKFDETPAQVEDISGETSGGGSGSRSPSSDREAERSGEAGRDSSSASGASAGKAQTSGNSLAPLAPGVAEQAIGLSASLPMVDTADAPEQAMADPDADTSQQVSSNESFGVDGVLGEQNATKAGSASRRDRAEKLTPAKDIDVERLLGKIWKIAFLFDSAVPAGDVNAELGEVLAYSQAVSDKRIYVIGYADNRGPREYNRDLSERRAERVARILRANGVPNSRMVVEGMGSVESLPEGDSTLVGRLVEVFFGE